MKNSILLCAALAGLASANVSYDTLLIRKGNAWVYAVATSSGSNLQFNEGGTRRLTLDSVAVFPDSVKFHVMQIDSIRSSLSWSTSAGQVDSTRSIDVDTTSQWFSFRSGSLPTGPLFTVNQDLRAPNGRYVYRGDTLSSLRYVPQVPRDCTGRAELNIEGIGLVRDGYSLSCGTLRESRSIRLLSYNGDAFDSVLFVPVSISSARRGLSTASSGAKALRLERGRIVHGSEGRVFNLRGEQVRPVGRKPEP